MNLLVIGSKGFIGSHCLEYFQAVDGVNTYGCDVVIDYNADNYFLVDSTNANFHRIFETNSFDVCINCSGAASVAGSLENPYRDFELNTKNVLALLNAMRIYSPLCKFINLSSAAIYGNPKTLPIKESDETAPISPYGIHKKQAEEICSYFFRFYKIPTCSLRIFSAFGERLRKQIFWDLYLKSKKQQQIELWGTGNESRDFIHVEDIIQIIALVIKKGKFTGNFINVANGKEIFIKDVAQKFYECLNAETSFKFKGNSRKGDPNNWVADISGIKTLGYKQSITLDQGIKKYISWLSAQEQG